MDKCLCNILFKVSIDGLELLKRELIHRDASLFRLGNTLIRDAVRLSKGNSLVVGAGEALLGIIKPAI